jgi:adenosylcobinamide-GDP ribazoletransferase
VAWLGSGQLPAPVLAAILVALLAALTGGLHVDGLADVFDGVSGGHGDRERIMAIMRDSRVGAHGALAVLLVLMVKVFALSEIVRLQRLEMVMLFPVVARAAVVALIVLFPYLREAGMGRGFKQRASGRHLLGAWAVGGVGVGFAGWEAAVPAAISVLTALAVGVWMQRRLGGLTGDVYGAAVELAEAAFLAVASR